MENTQLSLLNALFGGKAPGDAALQEKPFPGENQIKQDPQGFFSFLESLTAETSETGKEVLNAPLAPKDGAEKRFPGLQVEVIRKLSGDETAPVDGDAIAAASFVIAEPQALAAPDTLSPQASRGADVVITAPTVVTPFNNLEPATSASVTAAPPETGIIAVGTTVAGSAGVEPEIQAQLGATALQPPVKQAPGLDSDGPPLAEPAQPAVPGAKAQPATPAQPAIPAEPATPPLVAVQAQTAVAIEARSVTKTLPDQAAQVEPGLGEVGERPAPHIDRLQTKAHDPNLKALANGATPIADHAAPDALSHSALTREGDAGFDRMVSTRIDTVTQSGERNTHLNPVRDQIVAAVAARPGESKLEIRLDPPELGRVMIGFDRDGADIVRAVVTADSPDTLDLMRRNADVFQRALAEQGFSNLDLQFADRSANENAQEDAGDTGQFFSLSEDEGANTVATEQGPRVVLGRLDRRL